MREGEVKGERGKGRMDARRMGNEGKGGEGEEEKRGIYRCTVKVVNEEFNLR